MPVKRKNKPLLAIENARTIFDKVEWEGDLLYVARNWTFKEEFKDKKYESLRKALCKAAQDLEDYCALYRVEDEREEEPTDEEIENEEQYEADKVDTEACNLCGDSLDKNGLCGTCNGDD
jgi:hypothetical protein